MGNAKEKDLINILYVSSFGWLRRGGQISLWNLLSRLDRSKFNPILVCPEKGDLLSFSQGIGIASEIVTLPSVRPWNLVSVFVSLVGLSKIVRKYRIDLIHADDLRQILYFGILKLFYRIHLIWHIRVSWRNTFFDTIGFFLSEKIICTAKVIANKFKYLPGYDQKVKIIYNAIDYNYFKPAEPSAELREKYNINPQDFVIGVVSRLHPIKGIHFLIEAFFDIKKSFKNTKLIIVGDGSRRYKENLEKKVGELGLDEFVIFTGFKSDVRPFLNMLDLFILPTMEKEGSSRSILEAMACGVPLLTTDTGGNRELVEDGITGVIITKPGPIIIAKEAIRLLSQRELLIKMGEEGRRRVIERFGISENVRLTEDVYLSLSSKNYQKNKIFTET